MSRLSSIEYTAIGACAGAVETFINQPLLALKNILQEGRAVPLNLLHYYRGLPLNVAMMTPMTATQFGTNAIGRSMVERWTGKEITAVGTVFAAAFAGAVSATIASPCEMVILQQQKSGKALWNQLQCVYGMHGFKVFGRGLAMTIARESVYASGYLGLFPVLYNYLQSSSLSERYSSNSLFLAAGVVSGVFSSVASHPFDTIKTKQQAFLYSNPAYLNSWMAASNIARNEGLTIFWKGLIPRGGRIISAVFVLNETKTKLAECLGSVREKRQVSLLP